MEVVKEVFRAIVRCITLIILIIIVGCGFESCSNAVTSDEWNNGICHNDNVRYELRGVSHGIKYYVCPECGDEITRY